MLDFGVPGRAQIMSLVIGAIDPDGNPYTMFHRLEITAESAQQKKQLEKEKTFTGYIRFSEEAELSIAFEIPGRVNVLKSPFKDDNRTIYRITQAQFQLIKHLLKGEGVDYEIVEWPKNAKKPFLIPPGF